MTYLVVCLVPAARTCQLLLLQSLTSKFYVQVADDKLGQFLDQDIEASASHRNVLRHFLKSC
jgi:hypothetical protein